MGLDVAAALVDENNADVLGATTAGTEAISEVACEELQTGPALPVRRKLRDDGLQADDGLGEGGIEISQGDALHASDCETPSEVVDQIADAGGDGTRGRETSPCPVKRTFDHAVGDDCVSGRKDPCRGS